jgi:hypothetical protein
MGKTIYFILFALFVFINLKAELIYTDVVPDSTLEIKGVLPVDFDIDFDKDNNREFYIRHHETIQFFSGFNGSLVLCQMNAYDYLEPTLLSKGDSISQSTSEWYNSNHASINLTERWDGQSNKYIGLKFKIANNWHYGWLEISVPNNHESCTVHGYAYNNIPNEGIKAGETSSNSIKIESKTKVIMLYPNPAKDYLNIDNFYRGKIEIYSVNGLKLLESENTNMIDIQELQNGIYFVKSDNEINKFIKK